MWPLSLLAGLAGAVTWVMDAIFKLCSFGWVSMSHHDFFIWQYQDAKNFKWFAPTSPEKIRQVELTVCSIPYAFRVSVLGTVYANTEIRGLVIL